MEAGSSVCISKVPVLTNGAGSGSALAFDVQVCNQAGGLAGCKESLLE